ncbi:conjugative transposon protein TraM [Dyadobacter psychrotolerans]|uniref:Conjugative transposon protein TraM n=1 Tax=Dyadobacter psychrotolerans TaxID=2541721 RepID=A0A4R5DAT5_9BACT|nr:conjugative transposon protein TraM [Dyadobacter psychrotolerans]TDE10729.1 conjugative transposon protein TraM [Dyadobacter psychrotolerans]
MQHLNQHERFLAQRKFYLALPVLALPFVTFLYWVLFAKNAASQPLQNNLQGLNVQLPDAVFKDSKNLNKLSFYKQAQLDSTKKAELIRKDPYRNDLPGFSSTTEPNALLGISGDFSSSGKTTTSAQSQQQIYTKLKALDATLSETRRPAFSEVTDSQPKQLTGLDLVSAQPNAQIQKLQALIDDLQQGGQDTPDDEMTQLNAVLEKIIQIQNPKPEAGSHAAISGKQSPSVKVQTELSNSDIGFLGEIQPIDSLNLQHSVSATEKNEFYSLDQAVSVQKARAIRAFIDQDQTLVSGSTIKIRLSDDINVGGQLIAKDSYLYGLASLNQDRLTVQIRSVYTGSMVVSVNLSVYDLDGQPGIYIPSAISREAAKQSLSQQIQSLDIGNMDPSLAAQSASAGVQAAKSLLSKKTRLTQLHLKAGYQLLLFDADGI